MAVHLKKRAYEEFSHVIQESPKPQVKRLKITKLPKVGQSSSRFEDLELQLDGQSSANVLQKLLKLSKKLPIPAEHVQPCLEILFNQFHVETDTAVRTKIAWLIGKLCCTLGFYPVKAIQNVMELLDTEVSGKVLTQLWTTVLKIATRLSEETNLHRQIVDMACVGLRDYHQEVRCACLKVIGSLASNKQITKPSAEKKWDQVNIHTLVADYFGDPEPRVRSSSLAALIEMHQRGQQLEMPVYEQACSALHDDYERVRFLAVELVWIMSHIYPENMVKAPYSDEKLRLVDDAFAYICNMFNDSSYKVRAEAARLLGSMHLVSDSFLFQTLDKKLMSDLRRKKSLNEQAKEGFVEEFSSGAKWADDAPIKDHNPDSNMLMSSGACGAFVHGLEDEMMEVRSAAVDSLTELASQRSSSSFAQAALDFLVDCLNDEIEAVRLNAVNSLHKIVEHVTLLEDQLDNVHSAMEDACKDIREGIHQLLSSCRLMSKACLYDTVMMLLKNLSKYPQDRRSIWRTQQHVGKRHSELVYLLVPQLLSCHPFFATSEPEMDDPSYIAILILVFNAAESCPSMTQLFPEHVVRHYQYLRDSIPDLVPQNIKLTSFTVGADSCHVAIPSTSKTSRCPANFISRTMDRVKNLQVYEPSEQRKLLDCTIRDLRHAADVAPSLASTAQCSADYLQAQLLLSKAVDTRSWTGSSHICAQHTAFAKPAANQIIQLTKELEHLYLGLSTNEIALVLQLRLKAQALLFVLEMQEATLSRKNKSQSSGEKPLKPSKLCEEFFHRVQELKSILEKSDIAPDSFSRTLFNELLKLSASRKPSLVVKLLQPLLSHYSASEVDLNNKVQKSRVIIHEPQPNPDSPVVISAGLVAALNVDAVAENLTNPLHEIRIQVIYPDSTSQLFNLSPQDVKQSTPFKHKISTKIYLSHEQWSEACVVKLLFVKIVRAPLDVKHNTTTSETLPLSKAVEVTFHPKPASRA
nr:integrator complex subunit 4 [Ciona intestinalis]|eukprot:XP_018670091.1 integrator complex subunit 4 [Ciona intestinalis]